MQFITQVDYTFSDNLNTIIQVLTSLEKRYDIIACDFEGCSRYTNHEKAVFKRYLKIYKEQLPKEEVRQITQFIESDGLSHPSLTYITHFQVAWNDHESFVAILPTERHRRWVFRWLVKTKIKQIWHNLSFDGKHIMHHTGKLPQNFEDTEVLAKTLLNHVETYKAKTGLKELMGYKYSNWGLSSDIFNLNNIYDETLLKYSAIDACATYALYEEIMESLRDT